MAAVSNHSLPELLVDLGNSEIERIATVKSSAHKNNEEILVDIFGNNNESNHSSRDKIVALNDDTSASEVDEVENNKKEKSVTFSASNQEHRYENGTNTINGKIKDKNFLLAATFIEDARFGRTLEYNTDDRSLKNYRSYSNVFLHWLTILALFLLLCLALFEKPAVVPLYFWITMIMEIVCLSVIGFRIYQLSTFVPRRALLTDPKNIVVALAILVTLIDMLVYFGMYLSPSTTNQAIRVSRVLRPLFFINMNESRQVRRAFRNIRNTVPEIINVLIIFIFSILLFTLLAFKLFQFRNLHYRTGEPYFVNYLDAFFDLYVLVTTANSPDVMMPAYDDSPWFALFFISYIIINTYIFINLFLAVIYNSYRSNLKTEIRSSVLWKRKKLEQAFDLLKESDGNPVVTSESWIITMKHLSRPPTYAKINLYWEVLISGENKNEETEEGATIKKDDFLQVADLLNVYIVQDIQYMNLFLRLVPGFYLSKPSVFVRTIVMHRFFAYFYDLAIIANAVCIGLDEESAEWFFLSIFILEIILKIYAYGPREYFSRNNLWNWFDFTIIMAAFITTIIEASADELDDFPREALDFLLVLRCLRLVKIVGTFERFRVILMTILNIAPSLAIYGIVLLLIYYAFAIIGMECFANKIKFVNNGTSADVNLCGNNKLNNSEFVRVGYCGNNFNNILRSLVTLVELTVVNQWHNIYMVTISYFCLLIALGFVKVTNKAARIYFVCFHLVVVILIMNIIVAFVLEAFILEYHLSKNNIECKVEKTIENLGLMTDLDGSEGNANGTTLMEENRETMQQRSQSSRYRHSSQHRFRINKGHKNVEVLLQRMFEGELEDNGPVPRGERSVTLDDVVGTSVSI